jgi:hypothetical protein
MLELTNAYVSSDIMCPGILTVSKNSSSANGTVVQGDTIIASAEDPKQWWYLERRLSPVPPQCEF